MRSAEGAENFAPIAQKLCIVGREQKRAVDQLQQQQALQTQALLNAIRGQWDAAQFGMQSVESILVALNPNLHGKVHAVPFGPTR